ncbi:MAG: dienelactone hydrolase family protein [Rhodospirillales bacterium]|nr:dienelactone hydrolase family protein [Rhodospirillales bacterium]MBO6788734.1 dienelactone hydrolase family protein [Rhodospirillales bacterium]
MYRSPFKLLLVLSMTAVLSACVAEKKLSLTTADAGTFQFASPKSYWKGQNIDLIGTLDFPENTQGKVPVMVIMHGSAGQGYRDGTWAKFFNANGIASFKVDYYSTRGMSRGGPGGPKNPHDLTGAIKFLKTHPRIDASKVGTIGFSRGGSIVMSTLQLNASEFGGQKPVLNVNLYGNCIIGVDKGTTDAPVLIIVGDEDNLSPYHQCESLGELGKRFDKDIRVHVMPGGTHAFDDNKGGNVRFGNQNVTIYPSAKLAAEARQIVLTAAKEAFK